MPSTRPSREAVALLREWVEQLEGQVSAIPEHKAQQLAEEVVRVGVVGNPAGEQAVVLPLGETAFDHRPLPLHDLELDPDLGHGFKVLGDSIFRDRYST